MKRTVILSNCVAVIDTHRTYPEAEKLAKVYRKISKSHEQEEFLEANQNQKFDCVFMPYSIEFYQNKKRVVLKIDASDLTKLLSEMEEIKSMNTDYQTDINEYLFA